MLTMLESLNYSFRNPKNIIWVIYRIKQLKNYKKKKPQGVLRGPQLGKQRWRARLGILRVNFTSTHRNSFTPRSVPKAWFSLPRLSRNAQSLRKLSSTPPWTEMHAIERTLYKMCERLRLRHQVKDGSYCTDFRYSELLNSVVWTPAPNLTHKR